MVKLPTGPNPLPGLHEFVVTRRDYLSSMHGLYQVAIDQKKEVGFFENRLTGYGGQFWLAAGMLIASSHVIPAEVRNELVQLGYQVLVGTPIRPA